jgi:chromosome segregation and condensation protein ScpB
MSLTSNVESLLFALGRRTTVEELARILRIRDNEKILEALKELQQLYGQKAGPIVVLEQDGGWKMTVADEHLPLVRRVVSKTELPKGVMETLAILA